MNRAISPLIISTLALLASFDVLAARTLEDIPLRWRPTSALEPLATIKNIVDRLEVADFTDARTTGKLIGENREDAADGKVLRVSTRDDVAAFVTDGMRRSFKQLGFDTVKTGGNITIGGEVKQLFVTEAGTYKGEIVLRVWIKNSKGETLWDGVATGRATRWGTSYSAENYYEVISDTLIAAINRLLENTNFSKALTKS